MVRLLGMNIRPCDGHATAGRDGQTLGHHRVGDDHARGGDDFRRGLAGVTGVERRVGVIFDHELRDLGGLFAAKLGQEPQPEPQPVDLVRSLRALQDRVTQGDAVAHQVQRAMLAPLAKLGERRGHADRYVPAETAIA